MLKSDFIKSEARRIGVTPKWFEQNHVRIQPCDHRPTEWTPSGEKPTGPCTEPDCPGWMLIG